MVEDCIAEAAAAVDVLCEVVRLLSLGWKWCVGHGVRCILWWLVVVRGSVLELQASSR